MALDARRRRLEMESMSELGRERYSRWSTDSLFESAGTNFHMLELMDVINVNISSLVLGIPQESLTWDNIGEAAQDWLLSWTSNARKWVESKTIRDNRFIMEACGKFLLSTPTRRLSIHET